MQPNDVTEINNCALVRILGFFKDNSKDVLIGIIVVNCEDGSTNLVTPDPNAKFRELMDRTIIELAGQIQARQHGEDVPNVRN